MVVTLDQRDQWHRLVALWVGFFPAILKCGARQIASVSCRRAAPGNGRLCVPLGQSQPPGISMGRATRAALARERPGGVQKQQQHLERP